MIIDTVMINISSYGSLIGELVVVVFYIVLTAGSMKSTQYS